MQQNSIGDKLGLRRWWSAVLTGSMGASAEAHVRFKPRTLIHGDVDSVAFSMSHSGGVPL